MRRDDRRGMRGRRVAVFAIGAASVVAACSDTVPAPAADGPSTLVTPTSSPAPAAPTTEPAASAPMTTVAADADPTTTVPTTTVPTTTDTTTTDTSGTTTSEPAWPRRITMAFTGDILPHSPLWRQAERNAADAGGDGYDFAPMLAALRGVHERVDLAVCHLETPIAPEGESFSTSPFYAVPIEVADAIAAAGFDRCSTASNHAADRGAAGIDRTVTALEDAGVAQAGMARTPGEIRPRVVDVGGVPVTHLSYTWSYNGLSLPDGEAWRSALIEPDRILADAERARDLGAAVVVVSLHWGAEGVHAPTGYQREVADAITAPGTIDLVVGHHAHVLQPIEQVNGTWVAFGLGNVLSNLPTSSRWPAASQDAAVLGIAMTVGADGSVDVDRPVVLPTWVDRDAGWIVRIVQDELARDDLSDGQRGRLEASLDRTLRIVGEFVPGAGIEAAET